MPKKRKKMEKQVLKEFEAALLSQKEKLQLSLRGQLTALTNDKDDRNVLTSDDLGSAAKAVEEEDVACILAESEAKELENIVEALKKIKDGTFGICEGCDQPIPLARLEALPNAALCLPCKVVAEKKGNTTRSYREVKSIENDDELYGIYPIAAT